MTNDNVAGVQECGAVAVGQEAGDGGQGGGEHQHPHGEARHQLSRACQVMENKDNDSIDCVIILEI